MSPIETWEASAWVKRCECAEACVAPGEASFKLPAIEHNRNIFDGIHGGISAAAAYEIGRLLALSEDSGDVPLVLYSIHLQFPRAALGDQRVFAKITRRTRSFMFADLWMENAAGEKVVQGMTVWGTRPANQHSNAPEPFSGFETLAALPVVDKINEGHSRKQTGVSATALSGGLSEFRVDGLAMYASSKTTGLSPLIKVADDCASWGSFAHNTNAEVSATVDMTIHAHSDLSPDSDFAVVRGRTVRRYGSHTLNEWQIVHGKDVVLSGTLTHVFYPEEGGRGDEKYINA